MLGTSHESVWSELVNSPESWRLLVHADPACRNGSPTRWLTLSTSHQPNLWESLLSPPQHIPVCQCVDQELTVPLPVLRLFVELFGTYLQLEKSSSTL